MKQLELFNDRTEVGFAMSLTSAQYARLKLSNPEAFERIRQIRMAVHRHRLLIRQATFQYKMHLGSLGIRL